MSIRNNLLAQVLTAYGGTPAEFDTRNSILEKILISIGGIPSNPDVMNVLLADIVVELGGTVSNPNIRNSLLRDIVLASGGTITNPSIRNELIIDWLANAGPSFIRQWTIGNSGDDYGYHAPNAYGSLVSNEWYNYIDTVDVLIVDASATAVILQSNVSGMWGIETEVILDVEGFGQITLTWNGATSYINVGNTAFVAHIISQNGNSIGLDIFPLNVVPKESQDIITTLLEPEITTLNDNIVHTDEENHGG